MKSQDGVRTLLIWALTDGRAGNHAQAMGLAEAIARERSAQVDTRNIVLKGWAEKIPPALSYRMGARTCGWPFSGIEHGRDALRPPWPDLIIGAGRRVAPIVSALGKLYDIKTVQLLNPQIPTQEFDLIVAPRHDDLCGTNVISTLGSVGRMTAEHIQTEAELWSERLDHLPRPRVTVLLGGPSKSAFWREEDRDRLVEQMAALSRSGHGLMITPSRRSDPTVISELKADCDPTSTFVWDGEGANPYPGILGLAHSIVVTEDSVNMASEAAASGRPVHVFRVSGRAQKFSAFHEDMKIQGITRDFSGQLEHWSYTPLNEAERVGREIVARLFPS